jgi:hypothetical protein
MNTFFIDKVRLLRNSISVADHDPLYNRGGWNIHFWSNFLGGPGIFALGHVWTGEKNHFTIRLYLDPPQIRWKFGPNIEFYKGKSAENGQKIAFLRYRP